MSAKQEYHKAYVNVIVEHQLDGQKTPLQIIFEDGRKFNIDRVVERRRAAATKVGGTGIRYNIIIGRQERYIYEDDGLWFVEAIGT